MSYWNPRDVGIQDHDYHMGTIAYGATPMIHDILAAQKMYGAEMTTRTGDTTYGFNATPTPPAATRSTSPRRPAPVMTIWDAGGIDTLDASGYATNQMIDLHPGLAEQHRRRHARRRADPRAGQRQPRRGGLCPAVAGQLRHPHEQPAPPIPMPAVLVDNVGIAYGATIENAVGGRGNDLMIGNSATNRLIGRRAATT